MRKTAFILLKKEAVKIKLEALGFKAMRFWEKQVKKELQTCLNQIWDHIHQFKP
ncbi:DUF559 domain-containing protein [uncultured Mucilaginibacter sp.]|uniref:DUF559 domain-containing protein n=1 Tax=uncultured Mucilaginibacter sp. TaxID=797541 RepID=UPI002625CB1B|nr:DUF559 domain-containing protein [uncultured Mucilaginibacter sp.]